MWDRLYVVVAIGPAIGLLYLFRSWDQKRPEPDRAVWRTVVFGVLSCIPAGVLEWLLLKYCAGPLSAQGHALEAFGMAATTEELLKLLVVLIFVWRKPYFDEVMDGIVYAAAASLGFAMLENIIYIGRSESGALTAGVVRALTALPLHASASGIMGYFVGRAKMSRAGRRGWIAIGLASAVLVHGCYDWALMSGGTFGFGAPQNFLALTESFAIVMLSAMVLWKLVGHALALDDALLGPGSRQPPPSNP